MGRLGHLALVVAAAIVHGECRAVDYFGHYAHSRQSGYYGPNEVNIMAVGYGDTGTMDANAAAGIKSYIANLFSAFFLPQPGYPCVFASQPASGKAQFD